MLPPVDVVKIGQGLLVIMSAIFYESESGLSGDYNLTLTKQKLN